MSRPPPGRRADYRWFHAITTRWMDNDAYGHVNNVVYYSWFDTVVNEYLVAHGVLEIEKSEAIGLVVETGCQYFSSVAFPDKIEAGLRISKLGNSSVRYEIGIFRLGDSESVAQGHFVHVYVTRDTRRPCPIPTSVRDVLQKISA